MNIEGGSQVSGNDKDEELKMAYGWFRVKGFQKTAAGWDLGC